MKRRETERQRRKRLLKQRSKPTAKPTKSSYSIVDPMIGYFAHHGMNVLCEDDGCLITGSAESMKRFVHKLGMDPIATVIRATTFSEIYRGNSQSCLVSQNP